MENAEPWVFECNIEIKSEPVDHNDESHETRTESSTSNAVHSDKSLPCDSSNHEIDGKELKIEPGQVYDDSDKFSVESGHVASTSNNNFSKKLLEGIYILETQRVQAIKELDELYELQEQALSDPIAFVEKLQNHNVNFSAPSNIDELPAIDWTKYQLNFNTSRIRRQQTKLAYKISDLIEIVGEKRKSDEDSLSQNVIPKQRYKLWTAEEQKRLEELLIQFPPEAVQTRRFEKIASFLEDRTPGQIAGRVKKYFRALKKHGIPVKEGVPTPGHVTKDSSNSKKKRKSGSRPKKHKFHGNQYTRNKSPNDEKTCSCLAGPNVNTYLVSHQPPAGDEGKSKIIHEYRRKLIRHNFFKFWTDEEQKKLDDLLIQFPPEEVENSRWEKIAQHLKNRTPFQIASRVKYLKWLMQNGKFVPGKIPGINFHEVSNAEIPRYKHGSNIMQYWTPEEQRKLEELLIVFPPEKHENQRWKKIADCLGNRTAAQVGSRAKNYFVKCKRYGLPVPGKVPRNFHRLKFGNKRACKVIDGTCLESSTCLESYQPASTEENSIKSEMDSSVEKDINQELEQMDKALKEKQSSCGLAHIGFKCSRCEVDPIIGVRWHCTVCSTQSVDFCSDCCASECKELDEHRFDHPLEAIQVVTH